MSFGFVVFNAVDWLGRALPGFGAFVSTDKRRLIGASYLRAVFIVCLPAILPLTQTTLTLLNGRRRQPLLLLCNVQAQDSSPRTAYVRSDIGRHPELSAALEEPRLIRQSPTAAQLTS